MEMDVSYWKNLAGISALLIFLVWDITKRYRRDVYWFPTKALVLSGLTLQLLGYFDSQNVNVFGNDEENEVKELLKKQLVIDINRLTLCVFLAYVLPEMPLGESAERLANIAALVISLFFHIASEVYTFEKVGDTNEGEIWFISSSTTLSLGATCLVLYLALAILSGKFIRDETTDDIANIHCETHDGNEGAMDRWGKCKSDMLKLWLTAHAWQKRYALLSPGLTPGVGAVLTICVAVMGVKLGCQRSHQVGLGLTFYLHCIFILIGWSVILRRWFVALCKDFKVGVPIGPLMFIAVPFLYMRAALNPIWKCLPPKLLQVWMKMIDLLQYIISVILILPMLLLIIAFSILLLFSHFCWRLPRLIIPLCKDGDAPDSKAKDTDEFPNYKEILTRMVLSEEEAPALWEALSRSFHHLKNRMDTSYQTTGSCKELLALIRSSVGENRSIVEEHIGNQSKWKEAAVSTINVLKELRVKYGWNFDWNVKDLIGVYKEVRDLLEFADYPQNLGAGPMNYLKYNMDRMSDVLENLAYDCNIVDIERSLQITKHPPQVLSLAGVLSDFQKKTDKKTDALPYNVIMAHSASYRNEVDLANMVATCLGDVIVCCALRLRDMIVEWGGRWMRDLEEEKIRKACEIAAKVSAILDGWNPSESQRIENANTTTEETCSDIENVPAGPSNHLLR